MLKSQRYHIGPLLNFVERKTWLRHLAATATTFRYVDPDRILSSAVAAVEGTEVAQQITSISMNKQMIIF
jgi:hypothetical protein